MSEWKLTLNENQMKVLEKALDVYSRFLMGQINIILEEYPELSFDERIKIHDYVRQYIHVYLPPNAFHGIYSDKLDVKAKISYDIYQVIRQVLSYNENNMEPNKDEKDWNAMWKNKYDEPLKSSNEPLPKVEKINYH